MQGLTGLGVYGFKGGFRVKGFEGIREVSCREKRTVGSGFPKVKLLPSPLLHRTPLPPSLTPYTLHFEP